MKCLKKIVLPLLLVLSTNVFATATEIIDATGVLVVTGVVTTSSGTNQTFAAQAYQIDCPATTTGIRAAIKHTVANDTVSTLFQRFNENPTSGRAIVAPTWSTTPLSSNERGVVGGPGTYNVVISKGSGSGTSSYEAKIRCVNDNGTTVTTLPFETYVATVPADVTKAHFFKLLNQ